MSTIAFLMFTLVTVPGVRLVFCTTQTLSPTEILALALNVLTLLVKADNSLSSAQLKLPFLIACLILKRSITHSSLSFRYHGR